MAHIVCSAESVATAAQARIDRIKRIREDRDETAITKAMLPHKVWFKTVSYTREEAIKFLNEDNFFGWQSQYAWGDLDLAKKLLILAQHGDPVTIDEESARVLWA